jgi:hypothetical protein
MDKDNKDKDMNKTIISIESVRSANSKMVHRIARPVTIESSGASINLKTTFGSRRVFIQHSKMQSAVAKTMEAYRHSKAGSSLTRDKK